MITATAIEAGGKQAAAPDALSRFRDLFNQMASGNIGNLSEVYSNDVIFTDPFRTVRGLEALEQYLRASYNNVIECRFEFADSVVTDNSACLTWRMMLRHKRIRGGAQIHVDGASHLCFRNGKVFYHRDYFDIGQLLYENLPLLGRAVRWLRKHAG